MFRKNLIKSTVLALTVTMLFTAAACGSKKSADSASVNVSEVATTESGDVVKNDGTKGTSSSTTTAGTKADGSTAASESQGSEVAGNEDVAKTTADSKDGSGSSNSSDSSGSPSNSGSSDSNSSNGNSGVGESGNGNEGASGGSSDSGSSYNGSSDSNDSGDAGENSDSGESGDSGNSSEGEWYYDLSWYGDTNPGSKYTGERHSCYNNFVYDESLISERIMAMQAYYPEGTAWDGTCTYFNARVAGGKGLGTFWGGGGCNAFACMISDAAFGNRQSYTVGLDDLRVGDVIFYNFEVGDTNNGHVVIITGITTGTVLVDKSMYDPQIGGYASFMVEEEGIIYQIAEGNTNSKIYWSDTISQYYLSNHLITAYSRY